MTAAARFRRLLADWLFSWRDWFTFLIVLLAFLSVVGSVDGAHPVDGMPSLYPIALVGLLLGFFLARLPWREWAIHLVALLLGAAALLGQVLAVTPGDGLQERAGEMVRRVHLWLEALFNGGISSDNLPVIVIIVVLTWVAAYLSSWSLFRWNNPWLALVPGGLALLINMSYLPRQSSASFFVFLLGAILLVARMHFSQGMKQWRRTGASYPRALHLSSINQAFWAGLLLLGVAWLIPVPGQARALQSAWDTWAHPVADEFAGLSRVFTAVEGKKGLPLSRTDSILPFRGSFSTTGGPIMSVKGSQPAFLRALVYDAYVSHGWKMSDRSQEPLTERSQETSRLLDLAQQQHQVPTTVEIEVVQGLPVFVAPGQPLGVDVAAQVETAADPLDVTSLRPLDSLKEGDHYTAVGLVSTAPADLLAAAGSDYPSWVTERYLQLPGDLPESVASLARDITRYDDTPYEKASSIQDYLRRYPVDLEESAPPSGRDAVEYFLFERRRGHPLYHASAMVVLLRTLGIPARLAAGFIIHPSAGAAGADGISQVGAEDASAWPEVYFSGFGWIQFSPAPVQPLASGLEGNVSQGPIDTSSMEQLLGLSPPPVPEGAARPAPQEGSAAAATGNGLPLRLALLCVSTVLALSIVSALAVRYAWNRGLAGLTYPAQLWEKTRRLSSWAGVKSQPWQTPREFAARLQRELPDVADLSFLVRVYERIEFGRGHLADEERPRLASLWKKLRSRLLRRLVRRR
jgi:transglutaminase-like putative cysteine protease